MKKNLLLFICFTNLCVNAQTNAEYIDGGELTDNGKLYSIAGRIKDQLYVVKLNPKTFSLEKLDEAMKTIESVEFVGGFNKSEKKFSTAKVINGRLYVSFKDEKNDGKDSHTEEYDPNTLKPIGAKIKFSTLGFKESAISSGAPILQYSSDRSKIISYLDETQNKIVVEVMKPDLSADWSHTFTSPYKEMDPVR